MTATTFSLLPDSDPRTRVPRTVARDRSIGFYRADYLEECVAWAWQTYLPYPALRLKAVWWESVDGQGFAEVEWVLYRHEAVSQSEAARIIGCSISNIWRLTLKTADLRLYRKPDSALKGYKINPRTGQTVRPYYMRESEVRAYAKENSRG